MPAQAPGHVFLVARAPASSQSPAAMAREARSLLVSAGLIAATFLAYLPAVNAEFIWNDSDYVTAPALRSLAGLWRIWFEVGATEQYYPFLHSAFWVQHRFWGDHPTGYHVVNILLHAGSASLLLVILRRLAIPGAVLAAFLFALHPVYVESVAWISEQKNTLSLFCFLWAALIYFRFDTTRRASAYWAATAVFVIALLSKSVTATLPPAPSRFGPRRMPTRCVSASATAAWECRKMTSESCGRWCRCAGTRPSVRAPASACPSPIGTSPPTEGP